MTAVAAAAMPAAHSTFELSNVVQNVFDAIGAFVVDASAAHNFAKFVQQRPWHSWQIAQVAVLSLISGVHVARHGSGGLTSG